MTELLQPGFHPDADELSAFVERALPAHEREHVLAHLAVCSECRAVVALSLPQLDETPQAAEEVRGQPARRRWFAGWRFALPAAAAVAAMAVFIVYINHTAPGRTGTATQMAVSRPPAPPQPAAQQEIAKQKTQPSPEPKSMAARVGAVPSGGAAMRDAGAAMGAQNAVAAERQATNRAAANQLEAAPPAAVLAAPSLQSRAEAASPAAAPELAGKAEGGSAGAISMAGRAPGLASTPRTLNAPRAVFGLATERAVNALQPLPSGLPIISMAARGPRLLAIDARNAVFLSEDGGQHWTAIAARWKGRAVSATLVSYNAAGGAGAETGQSVTSAGFAAAGAGSIGGPEPVAKSRNLGMLAASSLAGTVTDASGAVIAGATVTVTAADGKSTRAVSTDKAGRYVFAGLAPGGYRVEVRARGFASQTLNGVAVAASMQAIANVSLAVGASSESVMVSADQLDLTQSISPQDAKQAMKKAGKPAAEAQQPVFEITTDNGQRWTSADGASWTRSRTRK